MFGDRGLFRQQNMEKRKWMSVREWVELCNKDDFRAPGIREVSLASRTVPVAARPRVQRRGKRKAESVNADGSGPVVQELQDENTQNEHAAQDIQTPPPAPVKEEPEPSSSKVASKKANATKDGPKPRAKRVHPTREAREASLADRAARDRAFIDVFDPHSAWLPPDTKVEDYAPEFCHQLERRYWRGLGLGGKPAWYGADTQGRDSRVSLTLSCFIYFKVPCSPTQRRRGMLLTSLLHCHACFPLPAKVFQASTLLTSTLACGGQLLPGTLKTWIYSASTTYILVLRSSGMQSHKDGQLVWSKL